MSKENIKKISDNEEEPLYHSSFNLLSLRTESELYKDEDNIKFKTIRVRRINLRKEENWEILQDDKIVFILNGIKFSKKEREFFRSVDGIRFIIDGFKSGWKSVIKYKNGIKALK